MFRTLSVAVKKLRRDSGLPLSTRLSKSVRYVRELVSARYHLRSVDSVGRGVRTLEKPRIDNQGRMTIGMDSQLRSINVPVELCTGPGAELVIGSGVHLNYGVSIGAMGSIRIGDRVLVGPYAMIIDTEFHDPLDRNRIPAPRPVVIEDDAWIGAKASILPGVTVGTGAIVGVGAVVGANVPPFTVVVGNPARAVKRLDPQRAPREGSLADSGKGAEPPSDPI